MKITSDITNITSGMHVFETPDHIIINSQIYNKFSMKAEPYIFFNINTLANKNLLKHEINILEYNYSNPSKEPEYEYYIQDNQDSSTFYCISEIGKTDQNQYLHKIKYDSRTKTYNLLKSISPDTGYRKDSVFTTVLHYKLLGQTKNFIILMQKTGYGAAPYDGRVGDWDLAAMNRIGLIAVRKSDFSVKIVELSTTYDEHIQKVKEFDDYVIIYENANGKIINFYSYYPEANSLNKFFTKEFIGNDNKSCISNLLNFDKNVYYAMFSSKINNPFLVKFSIDFEEKNVNYTIENTSSNNLLKFEGNSRNDYLNSHYMRYVLHKINDNYISATISNNQNIQGIVIHHYAFSYFGYWNYSFLANFNVEVNSNLGYNKNFLFKKSGSSWENKNIINQNDYLYGILFVDKFTMVYHLQTGIQIYKLDLDTETYNKVFEASGTFQTIGLDENNNFYTFDVNNKCQMYNLNSCSILNGRFEYDTYNYDGEDIETTVTIASKNFIGELIASKIHVELSGNCKFRNESQEAILTTRLDTEYQVPVIITGPGVVYCNINEVE